MDYNDKIVDEYLRVLSNKIENSDKFALFKTGDPDFDKELVINNSREIALNNMEEHGEPNIQTYQFLDILKNIKKSNIICKLLELNHAYITHIDNKGKLVYVFTNSGYDILKNSNLI